MNTEHLKKIDNVLKELTDCGYAAGGSVLILRNGTEQYYTAYGKRDIEANLPIERDTIFRLYSMTKPITAAAVMMLFEDGLLDLEAPVGDYIDTYKNQTYGDRYNLIPVHRPMIIKDLLDMRSGLCYNGILNMTEQMTGVLVDEGISRIGSKNEMTTMEFAERLGSIPLMFSPGEGYNYSFSADVLGAIIEKISGMKFGEFLKERIFEPLGMKDTGFWVPEESRSRLTKVYRQTDSGLEEFNYNHLIINLRGDHAPAFESGGAGLFSTLDDYSHFGTMLLNRGEYNGKRLMQKATVDFMTGASMSDEAFEMRKKTDGYAGYEYANLMRIMKDPSLSTIMTSDGEYGWDGWLGPYFINDPVDNVTFLLMLQRCDTGTNTYTRRIRNIVFSAV